MLILVAVTVTITKEGGLFATARTAQKDTAYNAEEETLLTYIYADGVYNATTGEVNLTALKELLTDATKWQSPTLNNDTTPTTLTVTGVQSGKSHTIDSKGNVSEQKDGEDQTSTSIVGTYYGLADLWGSGHPTLKFDADGTVMLTGYDEDGGVEELHTGVYTYDAETKTGNYTTTRTDRQYGTVDTSECSFNLINLGDNVIIEVIDMGVSGSYHSTWAKNKCGKIVDLGEATYSNGTETVTFGTRVEDGLTMGTYVFNGASSYDGYYICYNGKLMFMDDVYSISEDLSTITDGDETYTKQ